MEIFSRINWAVLGKNGYTNLRRIWTIFDHKIRFFSLEKLQKIQFWVQWLQLILNKS